mmetsp:Transcript_32118/g.49116  ORF Transcript_32118/g.49116 Transcript_32118/m.49116 type:complete len:99 (+) Transcript_32118:403-699(+)
MSEFAKSSPDLVKLIQSMLEFNPHFRQSAKELLRSPIFDKIRRPEMEKAASSKLSLAVDADGVYDYEDERFLKYELDDYKKMLKTEAKLIRKAKVIYN